MCECIWSQKIPPEPRQEEAKEDRARPDLLRSILPFRLGNGSEFQKEEISLALIFVGWALLPVVVTDGQKCPSYSGHGTIDVRVSRQPKLFLQMGQRSCGRAHAFPGPGPSQSSSKPAAFLCSMRVTFSPGRVLKRSGRSYFRSAPWTVFTNWLTLTSV